MLVVELSSAGRFQLLLKHEKFEWIASWIWFLPTSGLAGFESAMRGAGQAPPFRGTLKTLHPKVSGVSFNY